MISSGMIWHYVVSSHSDRIHEKGSFLTKSGVLPIHIGIQTGNEFIAGLSRALGAREFSGDSVERRTQGGRLEGPSNQYPGSRADGTANSAVPLLLTTLKRSSSARATALRL